MTPEMESRVYALIGEDGFARLTAAFYRRVATDALLGPMYRRAMQQSGETLADAEHKLREFLIFRFGGPDRYLQERGHPRLRARHAPFPIDAAGAERWIMLMTDAMAEAALPPEVVAVLTPYFQNTARMMMNR